VCRLLPARKARKAAKLAQKRGFRGRSAAGQNRRQTRSGGALGGRAKKEKKIKKRLAKSRKIYYIDFMDTRNPKNEAGALVQDARRRCGMNRREFAEAVGVTPQYMSQIEHGHCPPSMRVREAIAAVVEAHGVPGTPLAADEAHLLHIYRALSSVSRRSITTAAETLAGIVPADTAKE
jgi:DNA-binding XRE family transcriptional regulator